jgi:hypothetical protein
VQWLQVLLIVPAGKLTLIESVLPRGDLLWTLWCFPELSLCFLDAITNTDAELPE